MALRRTPNQIAEQWENLGRREEDMASNREPLAHLEEISSNLDEIRRVFLAQVQELSSLNKYLGDIDTRLVELRDTNSSLADIAKSLQEIAERA